MLSLTSGNVYCICDPVGNDKCWSEDALLIKQMFHSTPVVTWIFKEHSATQACLFSNSVVACKYTPSYNRQKTMKPSGDQLFSLAASNNKASVSELSDYNKHRTILPTEQKHHYILKF